MKRLLIFLLCASPCFGAATWVQGTANYAGNVTSNSKQFTFNATVGDHIFLLIKDTCSGAIYTASDNRSDTYTQKISQTTVSGGEVAGWDATVGADGVLVVTVATTSSCFSEIFAFEVYNTTGFDGGSANSGTTATATSNSVTPTGTDLIAGIFLITNSGPTWTAGSGYTIGATANTTNNIIEYQAGVSSPITASATNSNDFSGWSAVIVAYKSKTTAAISSIAVTPATPSISTGATQQFTATVTYADTSTDNGSGVAVWTSGTSAVASVVTAGLATGKSVGTSTITATIGATSGNTLLAVTSGFGYSADDFGGLTTAPCTGHPNVQSFTGASQTSGGVQTVTVANASVYVIGEPMMIISTGTAMDYQYDGSRTDRGVSLITNIVSNTITLQAATSTTIVGSASGSIEPARWYAGVVASRSSSTLFCSPEDHWMHLQSMAEFNANNVTSGSYASKYGDGCTGVREVTLELKGWGFNSTGEDSQDSNPPTDPTGSCTAPMPGYPADSGSPSGYAGANLGNYVSQPLPSIHWAEDANYPEGNYTSNSLGDFFDSRWTTFVTQFLKNNNGGFNVNQSKSPAIITELFDDTDFLACNGAGPDYHSVPTGKQTCHAALAVMDAAPILTYANGGYYHPTDTYVYPDPVIYSKVPMASPPANCTVATPCSIGTYLNKLYSGNLANLNTAWGSSYTTWGSAGTGLGWNFSWLASTGSAVTVGTGNGSTLSFTVATHANVSPYSIQIFDNGTAIGGDCPVISYPDLHSNGCTGSAGTGQILGTNLSTSGSINYSTGSLTVTFTVAPASGHSITANLIYCGWDTSCGTGLMDEDGRGTWLGTNYACLISSSVSPGTCGEGDQAAPNANAQTGADLDPWVAYFWAAYINAFFVMRNTIMPDLMVWGLDTSGAWYSPPHKGILQAFQQYTDGLFIGGWLATTTSGDSEGASKSTFIETYYTKPTVNFLVLTSNQGQFGGVGCGGNFPCLTTEAAKGTYLFDINSHELTNTGPDGKYHWGGYAYWSLYPFQGSQNADFGLKTEKDNAYDSHEDVTSAVACSSPIATFPCGNEVTGAWNGTDAIGNASNGKVMNANCLWFGCGAPPPPSPGCIIGSGVIIGTGTILCDDLTVNYNSPTNKLTFTYSTPNTLSFVVAASPTPSPFQPMQQGPNACPPAPRRGYVSHYTCKEPAQNVASCNCQ